MVTRNENGLVRVTVTLEPIDVQLLDALAEIEGKNRSAELRELLTQARPVLQSLVTTFQSAARQREALDQVLVNATVSELQQFEPEVEEMARRFLGIMAKAEGLAAAEDPRSSNTGVTPPPPLPPNDPESGQS